MLWYYFPIEIEDKKLLTDTINVYSENKTNLNIITKRIKDNFTSIGCIVQDIKREETLYRIAINVGDKTSLTLYINFVPNRTQAYKIYSILYINHKLLVTNNIIEFCILKLKDGYYALGFKERDHFKMCIDDVYLYHYLRNEKDIYLSYNKYYVLIEKHNYYSLYVMNSNMSLSSIEHIIDIKDIEKIYLGKKVVKLAKTVPHYVIDEDTNTIISGTYHRKNLKHIFLQDYIVLIPLYVIHDNKQILMLDHKYKYTMDIHTSDKKTAYKDIGIMIDNKPIYDVDLIGKIIYQNYKLIINS